MNDNLNNFPHKPVMVEEVLYYLQLRQGYTIVDCTVGSGGHATKIIDKIKSDGLLIGIDKDMEILQIAKQNLSDTGGIFRLYHANYSDIDEVLRQAGINRVNGVLLDLGVSSMQLDRADRGFSFYKDGPLDMRMDRSNGITAKKLIKKLSERELEKLLRKYGEERLAKRIATAIINEEKKFGITSTTHLAAIVEHAVSKGKGKIHPATRVFQALRIAVNEELENLEIFLDKIHNYMYAGARIVIISFHSLEDRIVKNKFTESAKQNLFRIITKKPVTPGKSEIESNTRCRSAKLRSAERI